MQKISPYPFLLLIAILAIFVFVQNGYAASPKTKNRIKRPLKTVQPIKRVSAPRPLRVTRESPTAYLTQSGILQQTNGERQKHGLKALTLNAHLNAAAAAKVKDMFEKRYFEHISPSGVGPDKRAEQAGYAFLAIGENLAMGNFENDRSLVKAWVESPGHRENILNRSYTEIGIAVLRGVFEGQTTWIAVQEFGRPLSACTQPNKMLQAKIASDKALIAERNAQANALNANRSEYFALVTSINMLIQQLQGEVTVYNGEVQAFNACVRR